MREVKELRELNDEELVKKVEEYKAELRRLVTEINTGGGVKNPARARLLRKSIARALTVLNERKMRKNVG